MANTVNDLNLAGGSKPDAVGAKMKSASKKPKWCFRFFRFEYRCIGYMIKKMQWKMFLPWMLIAIITFVSFSWLFKMTFVLTSQPTAVKLEYRVSVDSEMDVYWPIIIEESAKREDSYYKVFKDAEEHLRAQMNSWLTILGFFSVVLGLLVPLTSYLLQRQTLAEERDRIIRDCKSSVENMVKQTEKLSQEALHKADYAIGATSKDYADGAKRAGSIPASKESVKGVTATALPALNGTKSHRHVKKEQ